MSEPIQLAAGEDPGPLELQEELNRKTGTGAVVVMAGRVFTAVLRIGSTMILARVLTPTDYGIVGYAMTLAEFAKIFLDAGLSTSTIRAKTITPAQLSTLFWLNVAIGLGLAVIVFVSSRLLMLTNLDRRICDVLMLSSITFVMTGAAAQPLAILTRRLQFVRIVICGTLSSLSAFLVGIAFAFSGWGFWSLAFMQVANAAIHLLLLILLSNWLPKRQFSLSAVGEEIGFGLRLTGFQFVNYLTRRSDNLIIGTFLGTSSLGIYSKAYELLMLPVTQVFGPLNSVVLPSLCRTENHSGEMRVPYCTALNGLAWLSLPIFGTCIGYPELVIRFVLGEQWLECVPIFRILGIAGVFQPMYSSVTWIFTAKGRSDVLLRWGMTTSVPMVLGFLIAIPFGVIGFAMAYSIVMIGISLPIGIRLVGQISDVRLRDIVGAYSNPLLTVGAVAFVAALFESTLVGMYESPLLSLAVGCALFFLSLACIGFVFSSARSELRFWLRNVNKVFRRTPPAQVLANGK